MRIELYHFEIVRNTTITENGITSSSKPILFNSLNFEPAPIGRSKIVSTSELNKEKIDVKISLSNEFAADLLANFLDAIVRLTLYTKIDDAEPTVTWKGRMASLSATGKTVTLTFETAFTSLRRFGLRKKYQRTCPYSLYGGGCKVNRDSFSDTETIISLDGSELVFSNNAARPDGFFSGGLVEATDGSVRYIEKHSGSSLTLSRPLLSLSIDQVVKVSAGCNKSRGDCNDKFINIENYGGFPFIPEKNPFGGTSIA